jgi:hypothetical protein
MHLRPVAQLQAELQGEIFNLIQNPIDWSHGEPSEDEQQALWGRGSTVVRARIIAEDVYGQAVPVPRAAPSANANALLREVIKEVRETAVELDIELR